MSWKDYFFFTRREKNGLQVLLFLILFLVVVYWSMPYWVHPDEASNAELKGEIARFEAMIAEQSTADTLRNQYSKNVQTTVALFAFNPNTVDSTQMLSLGIKPYLASRIIKYRKKGGRFATATDFSKIYGLSEQDFQRLAPYIVIPVATSATVFAKDTLVKTPTKKEILVVDINTADTTSLMSVRGIGRVYANRIVAYREKLGGFVDKKQLLEVYGINEEVYEKISPYIVSLSIELRTLSVNKATVHQLKQHPYISFYQAKSIYDYRTSKKNKRIDSLDGIPASRDINADFIDKIRPYLSFE